MPLSKIQGIEGQVTPNLGRRNLLINGAMQIAQRGDVTGHANGYGGCDRFQFASSGATRVSMSQSTTTPTGQGFTSSQRVNCTTADTSLAAGDYAMIRQKIEGQNLQHLLYGTSSAKKLTLQFWVRSGKTGTHIVELYHGDVAYTNGQTYTIATADTWQKVTVTFDGYQTTALDDNSGIGIQVAWWLAAGSTYSGGTFSSNTWTNTTANRAVGQVTCMDCTSNNFYLTGVQLEVSDTATDFEHLSVHDELLACQRYYWKHAAEAVGTNQGAGTSALGQWNNTYAYGMMSFPVEMRAKPSGSYSDLSHFTVYSNGQTRTPTNWVMSTRGDKWGTEHHFDWSSALTPAGGAGFRFQSGSGWYAYAAEM